MMNLFDKVKVVCALVVMGIGLVAYSATPTVTSVTAQQRYPWNGLVDIVVTFNGAESDVAKANCTFAATNSATKTALAITHVAQQGNDTGSGTTWTRRFIWDTNADLGEVKIDDVEIVADVEDDGSGGVQLWEGGPYWATCNVGASKPEEYGLYFWWGDTVGHAGDWGFNAANCPTYVDHIPEGYIDSTGNLVPAYDAARKRLGAPWRMPTNAEFDALVNKCDIDWTMRNGVDGHLVTGRGIYASKSIFLPAAGYGYDYGLFDLGSCCRYWSSTLVPGRSGYAFDLEFSSYRKYSKRYYGQSVRPVRGASSGSVHSVCSTHLSLDNRIGMRVAAATERIVFSPAWETDAMGATAVVSTNGVVVKSAIEAGVFDWTPAQDGMYQLTHAVYVNGEQVGETLTATFLDEGYRRTVNCSFLVQQGEPQDEFDVTKAFAVLYKKVNGQYVEISRSGRQSQTFTVGDGTYRIEFQYADDTWVAANYSTELTVSQDSPGWAIGVEGRYIKAADTWSLWVQLYANEGDDLPYADLRYRGDARKWDEISSMSFDPNIDIPLSDLDWPHWALQSEEEVEWYEYDVINRKAGSRMPVGRVAGRRCITVWEKDVPYNMLRLVAKKKKVKKTVEIKFYKWELELVSLWAFAPEGTTTDSYVSPTIRDGERTEESFTVEDCEGVSFVWKTSCEDAAAEGPQRDHGEFLVDGKVVATRAGESDWIRVSIDFEDTGSHTITWRYVKDASGSSGDDCMWVSCINVEPIAAENPELVIETEQLPSVMEMEEYEEQLECSGGTEPYWWSMDEADYLAVAEESTFAEVGEAQGWYEDEGEWRYDLPFAFNFGGRVYDSVVVSDNACLYFAMGSNIDAIEMDLGDLYSESEDQDIFIERAADHVTFRWKRVLYSNRAADVNCAITLNADGTIRCSFGDSSYDSRQVWLSTARDGAVAEQSGADDIVFEPNYLPLGLRLDEETGVIYGAPEQSGHYAFNVYVSDGEGAISSKGVTLDVEANPNLRPVAEDWDHVDEHIALRGGESWTFSVSVSDPEDAALTYCWYYDGFVVPGATGSSFVLQTDKDMRGWHSLICEASDGVWFIDAGTWSFAIGGEQFVTSEDGADGLQVAVDNAVDGDVIYVGPGTYSPIENFWRESVRIIATDGYANTIIDGGGAASCVSVAYVGEDTNRMVRLEGFTLRNGCGEWGGGAQYAWLVGCVVSDNEAEYNGGGLYGGRADSCLIVGNSAPYGGGACQAALYNCTVVENCAEISGGGVIACEDIGNMIVWRNYEDGALDPVTTVEGDPLFVDAEKGDYRLAEGSPYIDAGDNSYVTSATDLDGKARIVKGRVDVGCYEYQSGTAELIETIVPGEKVEIDTGFDGCTVTGLPSGLKYNKSTGMITGVVTKPTAAEGAVVKFTKSGAETEELTIIVTAIPTVKVLMEGVNSPSDTDGCKVTGEGAYLVDKKVTLKASAPKGTVFVGWFDGGNVVATQNSYSFTMDKKDVALVAKFKKEVMSVGCETLSSKESFPAGVLGAEGGIKLDITTESGVKSVKVDKLPAGMKYDSKTGLIIGAPTKACDNKVVITVTANSGAVTKKEIEVCVAAMPVMAVGTFNGFVSVGEDNFGTFTLTTTDAGKLTAKVVTAAGTVSFSGTCWDAVEEGVYRATLTTKKGEKLTLTLDSTAAWDANQLSGEFTTVAAPSRTYAVSAQRNAFGKTWYFAATGDETTGWEFAYTEDTKGAALTMTLKADGSISIAGKLPNGTDTKGKAVTIKVSASGYANVGGLKDGAILADFAPVLTVNKAKTVLAITTNLWFDRKNEVGRSVGAARFVK